MSEPSPSLPQDDENLPPVEPPSAGFIVQLFLVPGLIVLAVIGVWALFERMTSSEQDWRRMVEEIRQENPHRRWRGAMGLIQILRADQQRGEAGQQLSQNPEIAKALADMLEKELESKSSSEEDIKHRTFLARGLRLLDVPDVVLPVLQKAMAAGAGDEAHSDVRKNAVASVAEILGRAAESDRKAAYEPPGPKLKTVIEHPRLVDDLIVVSQDRDPLMQQIGAYALGLVPTEDSRQRLEVLLEDGDSNTRINAAIGLARQKSTKGTPVFKNVFEQAANEKAVRTGTTADRTSRYVQVGFGAFALIIFSVWAFGTTKPGRRFFAAALSIAALIFVCWGIYGIVHQTGEPADQEPELESKEFAEHRKQQHNERFQRLYAVMNSLKAVGELSDEFPESDRKELASLVEPIAESHPEPRIRIDAKKTLRLLQETE